MTNSSASEQNQVHQQNIFAWASSRGIQPDSSYRLRACFRQRVSRHTTTVVAFFFKCSFSATVDPTCSPPPPPPPSPPHPATADTLIF
jgi:hypothetical protein